MRISRQVWHLINMVIFPSAVVYCGCSDTCLVASVLGYSDSVCVCVFVSRPDRDDERFTRRREEIRQRADER